MAAKVWLCAISGFVTRDRTRMYVIHAGYEHACMCNLHNYHAQPQDTAST